MGTVTNVIVQPMDVTWSSSALGFTEGDIEVTITEDAVDVTAHQEGTNVLTTIRTGKSAEVTLALKETSREQVKYILENSGESITASGGSSAVVGWGSGRDFTQTLSQAAALTLHPVTKGASDYSEDVHFWKAYPVPESLSYSGENPAILNITFRCFPDTTKDNQARLGVIGDWNTGDFSSAS